MIVLDSQSFSLHIIPLSILEPVCWKKWQKKTQPRNWFGELGTSRGSEWYQIDPKWLNDQSSIIRNLQMSPIHQSVSWLGLFLLLTANQLYSLVQRKFDWMFQEPFCCTKTNNTSFWSHSKWKYFIWKIKIIVALGNNGLYLSFTFFCIILSQ